MTRTVPQCRVDLYEIARCADVHASTDSLLNIEELREIADTLDEAARAEGHSGDRQ